MALSGRREEGALWAGATARHEREEKKKRERKGKNKRRERQGDGISMYRAATRLHMCVCVCVRACVRVYTCIMCVCVEGERKQETHGFGALETTRGLVTVALHVDQVIDAGRSTAAAEARARTQPHSMRCKRRLQGDERERREEERERGSRWKKFDQWTIRLFFCLLCCPSCSFEATLQSLARLGLPWSAVAHRATRQGDKGEISSAPHSIVSLRLPASASDRLCL